MGTFVVKYPGKISDVGKVLAKYVLKYVPSDLVKIKTLNKLSDNVASTLIKDDIDADDLLKIIENNGNLGKTLGVVKMSDGSVRWLEEGTSTWGWTKIKEAHWNDITNVFGPKTEQKVQEMIFDTIKNGEITKSIPRDQYKYSKEFVDQNGKLQKFHVVVSDRSAEIGGIGIGNVVTVFPEKIN
ncbi:MAG: hypothetical protein C5S41_10990 [Candidatus Methanomarinus sp.]|nr:MAG: hypothetical protein C5S41_10990 [ANME-2 cluster archaeon]